MNDLGRTITLCQVAPYVCILSVSVCKLTAGLGPAVDELEEGFFIGVRNWDQLVGNFDPAALY
jgi:hypothetical protein